MKINANYKFWLVVGSQDLYGEDTLREVEKNSLLVERALNGQSLPCQVIFKGVVINSDSIKRVMKDANADGACAGVIVWMHTFSPAKMWIAGLKELSKPLLHLHTQINREIPVGEIDMDYMNLHQSAHGDREFGYICTRLGLNRRVVTGHYSDAAVAGKIGVWMRAAIGLEESKRVRCARFGDNMRHVAVTEGDKVEAQIKYGWEVNYLPVGKLVEAIKLIPGDSVDALYEEACSIYDVNPADERVIKHQLEIELAMRKLFEEGGECAFTTNFEDLYGLDQLPGMACQRLMGDGYGFAGEGDWKTACLLAVMKRMEEGLTGGTAFMEDYTYHMTGDGVALGAHMLEVDPSIASGKVSVGVEPLGIGGKNPPARLKFKGKPGKAICVSIVDMGNRFRMIVAEVEGVEAIADMPNLPVAQIMWKPLPNLEKGATAWIYAGGAHHTVLSYSLTSEHMREFANMTGTEFVLIDKDTDPEKLRQELAVAGKIW
jgi:L-arabinose isomerase